MKVDGVNHALKEPATSSGKLEVITKGTDAGYDTLRHSTAHLMAWAVQELYPGVKFAFGPNIENGFYYDFDRDEPFSDSDLAAIEARVAEIIERDDGWFGTSAGAPAYFAPFEEWLPHQRRASSRICPSRNTCAACRRPAWCRRQSS